MATEERAANTHHQTTLSRTRIANRDHHNNINSINDNGGQDDQPNLRVAGSVTPTPQYPSQREVQRHAETPNAEPPRTETLPPDVTWQKDNGHDALNAKGHGEDEHDDMEDDMEGEDMNNENLAQDNDGSEVSKDDDHPERGGNEGDEAAAEEENITNVRRKRNAEDINDPESKEESSSHSRRKRQRRREKRARDKLFQDCISVEIPLECTADLTVALRHTRKKRIAALLKAYPSLRVVGDMAVTPKNNNSNNTASGEDHTKTNQQEEDTSTPVVDKEKKVPYGSNNRNNYSSVIDYLEAKYVKGVMIDDDEDADGDNGGSAHNDGDDKGSVYSESSFLDDTDLQRDVAEQVLANSTTTKMELIDDSEFFVNVGALEVEESELTQQQYDPLRDVDDPKMMGSKGRKKPGRKPGTKRSPPVKVKKPLPSTKTATKTGTKPDGKTTPAPKAAMKTTLATMNASSCDEATSHSSKKMAPSKNTSNIGAKKKPISSSGSLSSGGSPKKKPKLNQVTDMVPDQITKSSEKPEPGESTQQKQEYKHLAKVEADRKASMEAKYRNVVSMIAKEDLPRRKTKDKVALTCPPDKKPGDPILFQNPHMPGQRLKVKIPKNTAPGATFRVTVPVPPEPEEKEDGTPMDHNKWTREFYEALSDYAYHFDNWIDAITDHKLAQGEEYPGHFEKRKKFDDMVSDFPNDLKTPIDKAYLQKILRRARQNKHKRDKTAKRLQEEEMQKAASVVSTAGKLAPSTKGTTDELEDKDNTDVKEESNLKSSEGRTTQHQTVRKVTLPLYGLQFGTKLFQTTDFP